MSTLEDLNQWWTTIRREVESHLPEERLDRILLFVSGTAFIAALVTLVTLMGFQPYGHQPEIGRITASGGAKRREARSLAWQELHDGDAIYLRDTLKSNNEHPAAIEFANGRQLQMRPGSTLQIEEIYPHRVEVSVYRGNIGKSEAITIRSREPLRVLPAAPRPILALPQIVSPGN